MVCEHLEKLEQELLRSGMQETFRGRAWSQNCREWVYFRCILDRTALRKRLPFAACVQDHEHLGTHDGQEAGFVCQECKDAIIGEHPNSQTNSPGFK